VKVPSRKRNSFFTLIELLVVISLIAILAGIALPVFQRVQERGKATQDGSNLRQIGIATLAYLNDNQNQMFSSGTNWVQALYPNYASASKVYVSPFDIRIISALSGTSFPVSYGVSSNVIGTTGSFNGNMDKLTYPSNLIIMAPDINQSTVYAFNTADTSTATAPGPIVNPANLVSGTSLGTYSNRGFINVLFCDWHQQALPWATYTTTGTASTQWVPQ
jgi:prepilin-type N-terminal cleavage/methylation domain-containing protein/prepilin-type processing-associated H-X9-DG protein